MQRERPVFGRRLDGHRYIGRPSVYAVIRDEGGRILVVRTPEGTFLPGGGIESGEGCEQALAREAVEECGIRLAIGKCVGEATEIVYSDSERAGFEKESRFFEAQILTNTVASEENHEPAWLDPRTAVESLTYGSHRWAIQRALDTGPTSTYS